jgi:hypothetical protein
MPHVRLRSICGALLALAVAAPASARITSISFTVQSPTFGGTSFGAVGQYEKLTGRVTGEVDPNDPLNRVIVDIQLGQRNARGMVEYATDFLLLRPIASANGNRRLFYDITNRGNTNVLGIFNDANSGGNNPTTAADAGNGFLMRNGFLVLMTGWDFSAPDGTFTATVAPAFNRNGSHILGLNSEELVVDTGALPATLPLTYPASTLDKSKATLTVRRLYTDAPGSFPRRDGSSSTRPRSGSPRAARSSRRRTSTSSPIPRRTPSSRGSDSRPFATSSPSCATASRTTPARAIRSRASWTRSTQPARRSLAGRCATSSRSGSTRSRTPAIVEAAGTTTMAATATMTAAGAAPSTAS